MHSKYTEDGLQRKNALKLLQTSDLPSTGSTDITLSQGLYVQDFVLLKGVLPFIASVAGSATDIEEVTESLEGVPMRSFKLRDNKGNYVMCCAHGRQADRELLRNQLYIAFCFATAQAGRNEGPGQLWLYDETHIVYLKQMVVLPGPRALMQLRE